MKLVEKCAAELGEHFEAVQILVSTTEGAGDGTFFGRRGYGNWYARQGMAQQFVNEEIAQDQAVQIASQLNPEDKE